jgi:hypothetical protein
VESDARGGDELVRDLAQAGSMFYLIRQQHHLLTFAHKSNRINIILSFMVLMEHYDIFSLT